ncbi:MAG: sugar phosphate isomerase/epimerase, partial [Parasporobacterium sp.]|nr:sugar phosphate isomerase/epimerase [Parasporobacterium sp.]
MGLKLGATLFCYGTEYVRGQYDFEECVKQAALAGAEGYEIVATQMIPSYPNVSDEFLGMVEELKVKYGIGPVTYAANNDRGMRCDRDLTDDEMLADAIIDLRAANKLGCKTMRVQYMMSPEAFGRLAPYAELFDVKCGIEIHNPETPLSDNMKKYLDVIKATGSAYLGFVPDMGCMAVAPNKPKWDRALSMGVKEEHLEMAKRMRLDGVSQDEAVQKLFAAGATPAIMDTVAGMWGFVQFRPESALPGLFDELKEILPYSFEIHGKFHYLSEDCVEASIPYDKIFAFLKENDYDGYVISEYEDEAYCG